MNVELDSEKDQPFDKDAVGDSNVQNNESNPQMTQDTAVDIQADLKHINNANINMGGRDVVNNYTIVNNYITPKEDYSNQARRVQSSIHDDFSSQRQPSPPPADATLQKHVDHWFEHEVKTDREKFYVITLSIFNGVRYPDFKDIYGIILKAMEIEDE
jgi:hypothetical protein